MIKVIYLLKLVFIFFYISLLSTLTFSFFDLPWWLDNLSNVILIWIALLFIAAPFLLLTFKRYALLLLMPTFVLTIYHLFPIFHSKAITDTRVKLKSYRFIQANLSYYNNNLGDFFTASNNIASDFIFLFEYNVQKREQLKRFANGKHMYGYEEIQGFPLGIAVVSNYPIVYSRLHKSNSKSAEILELKFFDKKINKIIHSFLLHPPSPRTQINWEIRNDLFNKLNTLIEKNSSEHTLIAGDINVSPWSFNFPKPEKFTPCYLGNQYFSSWQFEKNFPKAVITSLIDHCFYNSGFSLINYRHIPVNGSDHQALVYQLQLVQK